MMAFLWIAVILLAAKISGLVEKWGQPAVLGELLIGVILGNLVFLGIPFFEPIRHNAIIKFLAELGVVILLFQIGLESNIAEMKKVGIASMMVAIIGVVLPFWTGTFLVGPSLMPGLEFSAYLFLGATLTATSVGITARVFQDLGKINTPEAKIVIGAAVIDDILGLVILAVVSAIVTVGVVSLGTICWIFAKAILFLIGGVIIGQLSAPVIGKALSKIHTGTGMKLTIALAFCLIFAYVANLIGLAPIVGAFAAGLVLDAVHFKFFMNPTIVAEIRKHLKDANSIARNRISAVIDKHAQKHVEDLIEPLSMLLVPIFFVTTGFSVKLSALFDLDTLVVAIGLTVVAVIGKVFAGFAAGKASKSIVGWGMVPRGEVGLIFATIGLGLGVISQRVFSLVVIMVIFTTLMTPPILTYLLKRQSVRMYKEELNIT